MGECCALCERKAAMQCDSDQAKLCWNCDERVHSANFLVAKHFRVLLCSACHLLTPWKASGPKLTPMVSFCHRCFADRRARHQQAARDYVDDDGEYSSDHGYDSNSDEDENGEEEEEDEEGENQVVPMSSASVDSPGETGCSSSSEMVSAALPSGDESTSMSVFRPSTERRINPLIY